MRPAFLLLSTLLALASANAATEAQADRRVVCISQSMAPTACDGVTEGLQHAEFLKRWPADHAIAVTTQVIRAENAPIAVTAGTLHVVRVVRDGKVIGTKPIYLIQMFREITNLSDGVPEAIAARNLGASLARQLNKAIASGQTGDR